MPVTQGDMQAYIDGLGLLTIERAEASFGAYLQDQRFITAADLRQLGYAPVVEVRQVVASLVQSEAQQFAELRAGIQTLFDQARDLSSGFDARAASATSEVAERQAKMIEAFTACNQQLKEHIDLAQRNNIASLELLKGQLSIFTEQKQSELLVLCDGRLRESAQVLYDRVLADARAGFGESRSSGDGSEQSFGKGPPSADAFRR